MRLRSRSPGRSPSTYPPSPLPASSAVRSWWASSLRTLTSGPTTTAAGLAKDLSGTGAVVVGPDVNTAGELAGELLTAEDAGSGDGG